MHCMTARSTHNFSNNSQSAPKVVHIYSWFLLLSLTYPLLCNCQPTVDQPATSQQQPVIQRNMTRTASYKPIFPSPSKILDYVLRTPSGSGIAIRTDGTCAICREELEQPRRLPCLHIFCNDCVRHALSRSDRCPSCNGLLLAPGPKELVVVAIGPGQPDAAPNPAPL